MLHGINYETYQPLGFVIVHCFRIFWYRIISCSQTAFGSNNCESFDSNLEIDRANILYTVAIILQTLNIADV